MKSRILLLAAVAIGVSSCSTMYKSGQTPDDLYYSPAPQQRIANNNDNDDGYSDNQSNQEYVNVQTDQDRTAYSGDDNYLRMKVRNRAMWSAFDDYAMYDAMYSPYYGSSFGLGLGFGYNPYSFYSPFSSLYYSPYSYYGGLGWGGLYGYNSFYNPYLYNPYYGYGGYYYPGAIYGGKGNYTTRPANSYAPRTYNLSRYGSRPANSEITSGRNAPVRVFRNNNNTYVNPGNSSGNTSRRRSFNNSGSDSRPVRTFDQPSRSSSPSPSYTPSSSGSRSSGGGSAPSRSPGRGGR